MGKKSSVSQTHTALQAFDCRKCGECCRGKGGIVIGPRDLPRLCEGLGMERENFLARYTYLQDKKIKLRAGPDSYCVFFLPGTGCSVHTARPDICRAWPFFRGNMIDEASLAMAKESCPGINPAIAHDAFVCAGLQYFRACRLNASDPALEANALIGVLP